MQFIDGYYDPAQEISYVIIKHKGKEYTGKAKLHPEDKASNLTGCRYAEIRAEIKALKAEYKEKKAACEECRKFVNAVTQYKNFDKTSPTAKAMYRQLNRRIKEVNNLANMINKKELSLKLAINMQTKTALKAKEIND